MSNQQVRVVFVFDLKIGILWLLHSLCLRSTPTERNRTSQNTSTTIIADCSFCRCVAVGFHIKLYFFSHDYFFFPTLSHPRTGTKSIYLYRRRILGLHGSF